MQKIIFFNSSADSEKLSSIVTDKSVDELKSEGIIPTVSSTLIKNYDESDIKLMYDIYHVDFLMFDSNVPPTNLVLNKEVFSTYVIENYKARRGQIFQVLDSLQNRALSSGKTEVVSEIEADKLILRNMPLTVDFTNNNTVQDFYSAGGPIELTIDYESKYESKLK
jgi:hypothetical protein